MQRAFQKEVWRMVKYILLTLAIDAALALLRQPFLNAAMAAAHPGQVLSLLSYGQLALSAVVGCLLHRYFTFRASEPWMIALPLMLVFTAGWQFVSGICLQVMGKHAVESLVQGSYLLKLASLILSYLFQRYVIYCHSTDDGGWYRRFHSTTDEEGAYPYE